MAAGALLACAACRQHGADTPSSGEVVRVAVAANFAAAQDSLAIRFRQETGIAVTPIVGATGQLRAQIVYGAPIDVFLAADRATVHSLDTARLTIPESHFTYARGTLVLYTPHRSVINTAAALTDTSLHHLAIADPGNAPYGRAAMEVLNRWKIRARVEKRLVRGESVSQTLQFVESGAADAAFVALSQVRGRPADQYWIVPDSLYTPILQDAVLLVRAGRKDAAQKYLAYLRSDSARAIITAFGYTPGDGK